MKNIMYTCKIHALMNYGNMTFHALVNYGNMTFNALMNYGSMAPYSTVALYTFSMQLHQSHRIISHIQLPVFNPVNCACAVAVTWIRA